MNRFGESGVRLFKPQVAPPPGERKAHYTPKSLAAYVIGYTPVGPTDTILEPCRGGGSFYDQLPDGRREWCEVGEVQEFGAGRDFFQWTKPVDWVITNPPFHLFWKFVVQSTKVCRKGFSFLISSNPLLSFTPKRLTWLKGQGFAVTRVSVVNVPGWFGRYYVVVLEKGGRSILDWSEDRWKDAVDGPAQAALPVGNLEAP